MKDDSACADSSGFLVPGAVGAPVLKLHPGVSDGAPELAFAFHGPFEEILGSAVPSSLCKNGTHNTTFFEASDLESAEWGHPDFF